MNFDKHGNLLLENMKEIWTEVPQNCKGKKFKPVKSIINIQIFLWYEQVIVLLPNPLIATK